MLEELNYEFEAILKLFFPLNLKINSFYFEKLWLFSKLWSFVFFFFHSSFWQNDHLPKVMENCECNKKKRTNKWRAANEAVFLLLFCVGLNQHHKYWLKSFVHLFLQDSRQYIAPGTRVRNPEGELHTTIGS